MQALFIRSATVAVTFGNKQKINRKLEKNSIVNFKSFTALRGVISLTTNDNELYTLDGSTVVLKDNKGAVVFPTKVKLAVPYFSQLDNEIDPTITCNLTSVAMVLKFFGVIGNGNGQLEDQLNKWIMAEGLDKYNHDHLKLLFVKHGFKDLFRANATIDDIKYHLATGNPVIMAGYQTQAGHISVAVGYDEYGLILHDPNGEWFRWGYEINDDRNGHVAGQYNHYSYDLVKRLFDFTGIWAHFPTKN